MAAMLKKPDEIKIFILYLLDKIGYPLNYPSIGAIMIQDGIVGFFDFADCFFSLVDKGLIRKLPGENPEGSQDEETDALYEVSETGKIVARDLSDSLMVTVRERSYQSALRHLSLAKKGAVVDYTYRVEGDHYLLTCTIRDREGTAMDLTVRVDSKYQLDRMMYNYAHRPEVVLRGVVALLTGDANYLFDQSE